MKTALILGISGQDGAYLSRLLLGKGYAVHGSSRRAEGPFVGLDALGIGRQVMLHAADLTNAAETDALLRQVEPDEVYMLSGQSSVGKSFACPAETFGSIATASLNVLESARLLGRPVRIFNAASTDSYGHCEVAATEEAPFRPRSPYGFAKVAAFEIARGYREAYGLFVGSGILSNHESPLRPAQFVTTKIIQAVRRIAAGSGERLSLGNVSVRRDWGWAPDYVEAYWRMLQRDAAGDFIIATGETNALSDFVAEAFAAARLDWRSHVDFEKGLVRNSEFQATRVDPAKAARELGWTANHRMRDVIRLLLT
jgi:GDPmannose 4,6-dehydratase